VPSVRKMGLASEPGSPPARLSGVRDQAWEDLWGKPVASQTDMLEWRRIKKLSRTLSDEIQVIDQTSRFGKLVGAAELRDAPVHRWFSYKEGYSPRLLGQLIDHLGSLDGLRVVDTFGGVATTALSGQTDPRVAAVRSLEYSPLAHFVGKTKLKWPSLNPTRLEFLIAAALDYPASGRISVPELASLANAEIFSRQRLHALLRARNHVRTLDGATEDERDFFLLGWAAVIEDLSGAMKDGRALRIVRDRKRRSTSLKDEPPVIYAQGVVKRALAGQWSAMIQDLQSLRSERGHAYQTDAVHVQGDARDLESPIFEDGTRVFADGWANLACFSPPYLNMIDYTEVHKLELWLLEQVASSTEFRQTRLGTLRSHPSIRFPEREYFEGVDSVVEDLINSLSGWMARYGARPGVGPVVRQYFEDMYQVWRELKRTLATQGSAACIVANSTFSVRDHADGDRRERWRLPVLSDVILAHLALSAGFQSVRILHARDLRPRNVRTGSARESVVLANK
jgi:hypothetical protein